MNKPQQDPSSFQLLTPPDGLFLGLSTMWGIGRFQTLEGFFQAAEQLGFQRFELNHGVTPPMLLGLEGKCITSVHEPCPADPSVEELGRLDFLISSLDPSKRAQGIAAVKRSIDLASRLGASLVILHPGRVNMDPSYETTLRDLYEKGRQNSEEYQLILVAYRDHRRRSARPHLAAVKESLGELGEYASKKGIRLGLENRFYYHEIPTPEELSELLDATPSEWVGFWYDVGHGEVLHRLGLIRRDEWGTGFRDRMVGVHLHDVEGIRDHRPAGQGSMNWEEILSHLPPNLTVTCEFQSTFSGEEIRKATWFLQSHYANYLQGAST